MKRRGKIPIKPDGTIDPIAADAALAETTDPRMINVRVAHAAKRQKPSVAAVIEESLDETTPFELMTQSDAITAKLQIQAKRETMNYRREIGELVEIVALRKGLSDLIAVAAEQLRTIPDRIAGRVAAETDERRIRALIDGELLAIQQQIANSSATLLQRLTATSQ